MRTSVIIGLGLLLLAIGYFPWWRVSEWRSLFSLSRALRRIRNKEDEFCLELNGVISGLTVTPKVASRLIEEAANWDLPEREFFGVRHTLISRLWKDAPPGIIVDLEAAYDRLTTKSEAAVAAIRVLFEMGTPDAMRSAEGLIVRASSRTLDWSAAFVPLRGRDGDLIQLLPCLAEALPHLEQRSEIYEQFLDLAKKGVSRPGEYRGFLEEASRRLESLFDTHSASVDRLANLLDLIEPDPEGDKVEEKLRGVFVEMAVVLDLLGHCGGALPPVLERGLVSRSYRLRTFAVGSIAAWGEPVDVAIIMDLAAKPWSRALLWAVLEEHAKLDLFPGEWRNQRALAEAAMVRWLQFPTEFGCVPAEIEPLTLARYTLAGREVQLWFFKFRHPTSHEPDWVVGVAGPYAVNGPATLEGAKTFSRFGEWKGGGIESHVREYLDVPFTLADPAVA